MTSTFLRAVRHAPAPALLTGWLVAAAPGGVHARAPELTACLARLPDDPDGARDYAAAWAGRGGGAEAARCGALALVALGDPGDAAIVLDGLAHAPGDPAARADIADEAARAWQADGDPARAFDSAGYGLGLRPGDPGLRIVRARAAVESGHAPQAIADLSPLPDTPDILTEALVVRASAYRRLGRIDLARADIDAAMRRAPQDVAALLERGIVRQRQGDMPGARSDWEQVMDLAPDSRQADMARQDLAVLEADPDAP
ncbi:tetratricopeptide repeat protein [Gluconacetobacter tumulisoli]|uniref:Tetratricopeptide repeat protein n=1 Tax=Gluconacetobacter tumulisoli TaxID=1286189 RepID=A0A7W4K9R3_9PROT|nr:tetratricopeptide repeat protein [Gluconacetobacter tumulisoli]MBB2202939.1 tetratricopeptide repeat protein [Gluconacetobacter tumulisoli]